MFFHATRRLLALVLVLQFLPVLPVGAAAMGNDTTTLYYLMELQRRYGKKCGGQEYPAAPSLVPSDDLSAAVAEHAASGAPIPELLAKYNISPQRFVVLRSPISTPQKTLAALMADQCQTLMGPYTMVGSARAQGQWWLLFVEAPLPTGQTTPPAPGLQAGDGGQTAASVTGAIAAAPDGQGAPAPRFSSPAPPQDPNVTPLNEPNPPQGTPPSAVPTVAAPQSPPQGGQDSFYTASAAPRAVPGMGTDAEAQIQNLFSLLNQARASGRMCGSKNMPPAPAFKKSSKLEAAAKKQAADMAARNYFSSTSPEGRKLEDRLKAENYIWMYIGELLAKASPPAGNVVNLWLSKPQQCEAIMNPNFTEAGIGYLPAAEIWVLTFGSSAPDDPETFRLE